MKEWTYEDAVDIVAKALQGLRYGLETDMDYDEALELAKVIVKALDVDNA